jgi:transposase
MKRIPPTRKSNPNRRKSREDFIAKQNVFRNILEKLERDVNTDLEQIERIEILDMLKMVLQGSDIRKILGINPKGGPLPDNKGYGVAVATHYYLFCDIEANEKTAASKVAQDWDLSLATVRRKARENRVAYLAWMSALERPSDTPELAPKVWAYLEPLIRSEILTYR